MFTKVNQFTGIQFLTKKEGEVNNQLVKKKSNSSICFVDNSDNGTVLISLTNPSSCLIIVTGVSFVF